MGFKDKSGHPQALKLPTDSNRYRSRRVASAHVDAFNLLDSESEDGSADSGSAEARGALNFESP